MFPMNKWEFLKKTHHVYIYGFPIKTSIYHVFPIANFGASPAFEHYPSFPLDAAPTLLSFSKRLYWGALWWRNDVEGGLRVLASPCPGNEGKSGGRSWNNPSDMERWWNMKNYEELTWGYIFWMFQWPRLGDSYLGVAVRTATVTLLETHETDGRNYVAGVCDRPIPSWYLQHLPASVFS